MNSHLSLPLILKTEATVHCYEMLSRSFRNIPSSLLFRFPPPQEDPGRRFTAAKWVAMATDKCFAAPPSRLDWKATDTSRVSKGCGRDDTQEIGLGNLPSAQTDGQSSPCTRMGREIY